MLKLTKCMDFTKFLTGAYSEINSNDHLHTEFVQMKFNMGTICFDYYHLSFSRLIDHPIGIAESNRQQ